MGNLCGKQEKLDPNNKTTECGRGQIILIGFIDDSETRYGSTVYFVSWYMGMYQTVRHSTGSLQIAELLKRVIVKEFLSRSIC